ncbi:unnamed protein product [Caenorhabditis auriculariae]|uniref:Uncharacterized protein n=1 Tax=Caenorhabditis auriculariae TaxID=2777116 RepID=A0A8S1HS30_9PELO|nr:unnamed protein product [Caenorhabditis auriculariae]
MDPSPDQPASSTTSGQKRKTENAADNIAKKTKTDLVEEVIELKRSLEAVIADNCQLRQEFESLKTLTIAIQQQNELLQLQFNQIKDIKSSQIQILRAHASPSASLALSAETLSLAERVKIAKEAAQFDEKSRRAVIERLPDAKNENQNALDLDFIKDICKVIHIDDPVEVYRHECSAKNPTAQSRFFSSTRIRDSFIQQFAKGLEEVRLSAPLKPRCRRDMTLSELRLLRSLRKQVYDANIAAGRVVCYLNDLSVIKVRNGRSFVVSSSAEPGAPSPTPVTASAQAADDAVPMSP